MHSKIFFCYVILTILHIKSTTGQEPNATAPPTAASAAGGGAAPPNNTSAGTDSKKLKCYVCSGAEACKDPTTQECSQPTEVCLTFLTKKKGDITKKCGLKTENVDTVLFLECDIDLCNFRQIEHSGAYSISKISVILTFWVVFILAMVT